ncbi:MAG: PAC2 family protein [Ilumatobacteraceae bacterium]|nr:PAC2 family protein [Ilumatobacteraceae bacterium]
MSVPDGADVHWLADPPPLSAPVLVVMMTGWIDAAGAAQAAMDVIVDETEADPILTFDDDRYVDYRARRPIMELREGLNSVLQWHRPTLSAGRDQTGRDLLLLTGPEPDMAWHRFCRVMGELAVELGVSRMVALGAYPFAAPHTRPPRLSVSSPSHEVLASVPFLRSSVDVPAGVAAALEHTMHGHGIPALGVWVQVPHYVATMGYPASSVALLDGLREAADVVVDAADLRQEALDQRARLDALVAGNDEHRRMVEQLEQVYDTISDAPPGTADGGPSLEMLSGDEIAAELERFLRDQD